ncbi:MAG: beta-ketoacyl-[acyl-carrier-protein] synthase II, partial [Chloroflexota bacterium]|nr:beta-ketoacyl-[acyl-carrier-protein] synthase II [Chloroflexota bacterium]
MTRVVVTGVGAVSPLGIGIDALWDGLTSGRSGVRPIQSFDASGFDVRIAGEVPDFVAREFMDFKAARRMDRFAQFGVAAAREAIADAGLEITDDNRDRIGIMVNTGGGGIPTIESEVTNMARNGVRRVSPVLIPLFAPNMASAQIAITFGIHGPTVTSVAACAAGVQAFVDAVYMLERGEVDV